MTTEEKKEFFKKLLMESDREDLAEIKQQVEVKDDTSNR